MSTQLLTLLQLCVLALLYLFFVRVLRSVWTEVHAPVTPGAGAAPAGAAAPRRRRRARAEAGQPQAAAPQVVRPVPPASRQQAPSQLVVVEPAAQQGLTYALAGEVTLGRSGACSIRIDDTYASSMHARITSRPDGAFLDDLGSTNGTYVNSQRVAATTSLQRGDLVQVGSTLLEVR